MAKGVESLPPAAIAGASRKRILVVSTRWNRDIVDSLLAGINSVLTDEYGIQPNNIVHKTVPGSFELPFAAKSLITTTTHPRFDACIAVGVLIKGETMHFEYISDAVSHGLMRVGLDTGVPVIFGVLTCLTEEQAWRRASDDKGGHNHGKDWARAAVEMSGFKL